MPARSIESTETDPVLSYGPSDDIGRSKSVDFAVNHLPRSVLYEFPPR